MKTIYCIDDDPFINEIIKKRCETLELSCETFTVPEEFLYRVDEKQPHLFLVDINFNGSPIGFVMMRNLKELYPSIPLLAMSAQTDMEAIARAYDEGVDDFIMKPIRRETFEEKMNLYLSKEKKGDEFLFKIAESAMACKVITKMNLIGMNSEGFIIKTPDYARPGTPIKVYSKTMDQVFEAQGPFSMYVKSSSVHQESKQFHTTVQLNEDHSENHTLLNRYKIWIREGS